jgi:hypothetical protein
MSARQRGLPHSVESATLADVLERVLDKGLVIAGDIKVKLVDIELLTVQIRLLVCSVDKAREMGIDWWMTNSWLSSKANGHILPPGESASPAGGLASPEAVVSVPTNSAVRGDA